MEWKAEVSRESGSGAGRRRERRREGVGGHAHLEALLVLLPLIGLGDGLKQAVLLRRQPPLLRRSVELWGPFRRHLGDE